MKKSSIIILVIVCTIIAAGVGGGVTYLMMQQNKPSQISQENDIKSKDKIENKENVITQNSSSNATTRPSTGYSTNNNQTKEKKWKYTHIALQGCVITESNSETGAVSYKKKCETCGTVQPGGTSTYLKGGIMNSAFYCSKCKKTQSIKIETTSSYE